MLRLQNNHVLSVSSQGNGAIRGEEVSQMQILIVILALALVAVGIFLGIGFHKTRSLAATVPGLVPQAGQVTPVAGGAIHHLDLGPRDAPVLVMIHGLGGYMQHFTYAMTGLLQDDFRLIVIDRPGCGYSRRDSETQAALPEQARMIWDLLDQLGVDRPLLVGHSLGGAVSLAMAVERPEAPRALALIAPLTVPNDAPSTAFDGLNIPSRFMRHLLARTWAVPMARARAVQTLDEIFRPDPWPADFLERGGGALGLCPRSFIATVEDYMAADRIGEISRQYPNRLKAPGGILFGTQDSLLDVAQQGDGMAAFGLSCEHLADHGHMLPITTPEDCAAFVRRIAAA